MPIAPRHPCNKPGCPSLTDKRFCDIHSREARRREVRPRGNTTERGYGSDWQRLRGWYIKRNPLCEDPYKIHSQPTVASHVDHKKKIVDRPDLRLDPNNLQSLCEFCHNSLKQSEERQANQQHTEHGQGRSNPHRERLADRLRTTAHASPKF